MSGLTFGSLFTGIGGLDLALEAFGHTPLWQAECDPYARAVLAKHWPDVRCYRDVKEIDAESSPVDIICGGFPCQGISPAGLRRGLDDERVQVNDANRLLTCGRSTAPTRTGVLARIVAVLEAKP